MTVGVLQSLCKLTLIMNACSLDGPGMRERLVPGGHVDRRGPGGRRWVARRVLAVSG
jgi:hypothetical protein